MRISDWSSDVCSSDLGPDAHAAQRDRKTGLLEAVAEVPGATVEVRQGNFLFTSGLERGRELLDLADPPTAIFAANDEMAAGVLAAAIDRGLTVPADLSLSGSAGWRSRGIAGRGSRRRVSRRSRSPGSRAST